MAVKIKLRFCPLCGSDVRFDYTKGVIYKDVTWRCTDQGCRMSKQARPLKGWNR